ncbi:MAG: transposase [Gammaproteobacteria bacterium]|nr:transposase [Gammaproteobacteria bacterium]
MGNQNGEHESSLKTAVSNAISADTFDGKVHVEWDPDAAVTPIGQLPFFIQYLKLGHLFKPWVDSCPLRYASNNAPKKVDVLGSFLLSILAGHNRYAHMTSLLSDRVNAKLLGMNKVVSDDSARRALLKIEEAEGVGWLQQHLQHCYGPLLQEPWILDCDTTVKPLYGHQQGAEVGYNPHKPGRPSHTYHTYMMSNLRLVLDVEVQSGKKTAASYSAPGLWGLLESIPKAHWPTLVRGDCEWGNEAILCEAADRGVDYLFKVRQSKYVKALIYKLHYEPHWEQTHDGWEATESHLQLKSWTCERRVVVMRRRITGDVVALPDAPPRLKQDQEQLSFIEAAPDFKTYEYAVLVTSLDKEVLTISQLYRDRADCENVFDEMKNHWGWGGFVTQDIKRCRLMARTIALIYNWWNLFVRLAVPGKHLEAITSRPLLLHGVGKLSHHSGKRTLTITHNHGRHEAVMAAYQRISHFFNQLKRIAPQLSPIECWYRILSEAVTRYLHGRQLRPPDEICSSA